MSFFLPPGHLSKITFLDNNMIVVHLKRSPRKDKKWRVTFKDDNTHVDFGAARNSDYTKHKDAARMRRYLSRHGGMDIPEPTFGLTNDQSFCKAMLRVNKSRRQKWNRGGMRTAGFWSRWLLWSMPNIEDAIQVIKRKFHIIVET